MVIRFLPSTFCPRNYKALNDKPWDLSQCISHWEERNITWYLSFFHFPVTFSYFPSVKANNHFFTVESVTGNMSSMHWKKVIKTTSGRRAKLNHYVTLTPTIQYREHDDTERSSALIKEDTKLRTYSMSYYIIVHQLSHY